MFSGRAAGDSDYVAVAVGLDCTSTLNWRLQGANSRWRGDRRRLIMRMLSMPLARHVAELNGHSVQFDRALKKLSTDNSAFAIRDAHAGRTHCQGGPVPRLG